MKIYSEITRTFKNFIYKKRIFNMLCIGNKVGPLWYCALKIRNRISSKVRVGFGPVTTGENNLSVRKWRIDPIVNYINKFDKRYICDVFLNSEELSKFDIIIIVKNYDHIDMQIARALKNSGKIFVFDIIDNPLGVRRNFCEDDGFGRIMDGIILSNPLQKLDIKKFNVPYRLIEHPIISHIYKTDYIGKSRIDVIWQGYWHNVKPVRTIERVIKDIASDTKKNVSLIYHTSRHDRDEGVIRYIKWSAFNAFKPLTTADIAISIRDMNDRWQARKSSLKILTYMAAGLPVVCRPTAADEMIVKHGKTGYFAYSDTEWREFLQELIEKPELREKMGKEARKYVYDNFTIDKIAQKYIDFFDLLVKKRRSITK